MESAPYQLDDNIAVDLVKYVRSNTIRNESQFLLLCYAYASGMMDDTHKYVSSVAIGTSSSGKTHLKDKVDNVFGGLEIMDASTGSDKSLIYDDEWDTADAISMGELQQPTEEMLEFMKRAHGGDEEVVIRTTRGNPQEGFETKVIRKPAKSYHFTFAQFDADFEFWNRLLKIPVHESESKNKAVGRMVAGHEDISIGDSDNSYGYDFDDGFEALRAHMIDVKENAPKRTILPNGGDGFDWDVWEVIEPIFNHSRSESNRVYSMVFNLIRSSALLNYKNREQRTVETDDGPAEAIVVDPQDLVNIIDCLSVLRSTTHEIDQKKRAIVEAIRAQSGPDNSIEGVSPIREFLKDSDAPEVKKGELEAILEDLQENFLIDIQEDAGADNKHVYRAYKWDALGQPRVDSNADLFKDCVAPRSADPFLDIWSGKRDEMETTAADILNSATIESGSTSSTDSTEDGDLSLSGFSDDPEPQTFDLNPWTETIRDRVKPILDGNRIPELDRVPVEALLGLTSLDDPDRTGIDVEGTMLDPTHDVWDQKSKPDEWVTSETRARKEIQNSFSELIKEGAIEFDQVHDTEGGDPVDATLSVVSGDSA